MRQSCSGHLNGAVGELWVRIRGEARQGHCAGDFTDMLRGQYWVKSMELEILSCQLLKKGNVEGCKYFRMLLKGVRISLLMWIGIIK